MEWARLRTLHIGDGHIDFDRFFSFVNSWGYQGTFTIESTAFDQSGWVDFDRLNESIRKIRTYLSDK